MLDPTKSHLPKRTPSLRLLRLDCNWLNGNLTVPRIWSKAMLDQSKTLTSAYPISGRRALLSKRPKPESAMHSSTSTIAGLRRRSQGAWARSEEHTSELQLQSNLVCRLLLEKKNKKFVTCHILVRLD